MLKGVFGFLVRHLRSLKWKPIPHGTLLPGTFSNSVLLLGKCHLCFLWYPVKGRCTDSPSSVQSLGKNLHLNPGNLGVVWCALKVDCRFLSQGKQLSSLELLPSIPKAQHSMRSQRGLGEKQSGSGPKGKLCHLHSGPRASIIKEKETKKKKFLRVCVENLHRLHKSLFVGFCSF